MLNLLTQHPDQSRLIIFFAVLLIMAILEFLLPKRKVNAKRGIRWSSNIGIVVLDSIVARIILPTTTIAVALYADAKGLGLFNIIFQDSWLAIVLSILVLDLLIYGQHVVFHKISWLWRFHRMHHSDVHIDVTTGIRFHPVEIILSLLIKFAAILILGVPALAILLFEIILNATAMITHSNLSIPAWLDKLLRIIFVTPDMHRVHHSVHRNETDSNYGFNFSLWDRLFGTYIDQPKDTHEKMQIGINRFRDDREQYIDKLLTQPFREDTSRQ